MAIQLVIEESPVCFVRSLWTNSNVFWGSTVDERKRELLTGNQIIGRQHSIFGTSESQFRTLLMELFTSLQPPNFDVDAKQ